jgi:betaine lipid synthase
MSVACGRPWYLALNALQPLLHLFGRSRSYDVSRFCHAFEVESGNMIGNCSPASFNVIKDSKVIPLLDICSSVVEVEPLVSAHSTINVTPPLSSFHYHVGNVGRLSSSFVSALKKVLSAPGDCRIVNNPVHKEFRTFIYSFTWVGFVSVLDQIRF